MAGVGSLAAAALLCVCLFGPAASEVSQEARDLALEWAPLVWIHSEDPYYPSTVEFDLDNTEIRDANESAVMESPTRSTIPYGPESDDLHVNTHEDLDCISCTVPHFAGQPVSELVAYAQVIEHGDECGTIDVAYHTFYPYNYGKVVCVGLEIDGVCHGIWRTYGNHVGDWEHTEMRFQNGKPTDMYLAVHSFGAFYAYNESEHRFDFYYGEPLVRTLEDGQQERIPVEYPPNIFFAEGNHPEVFSANGSHGTWATEGKHTYFHFVIHLDDYCDRGDAWRLWEAMEFVDRGQPDDDFIGTEDQYILFEGRWGNIAEMGCFFEPLFGECGLVAGPGGPGPSGNFELPPKCPEKQY